MNNLHITVNSFRCASRILKETSSLVRSGLVDHVYIAALHEEGLAEHERIDDKREVWRVRLGSRRWARNVFVQFFKYVEYCAKVFSHFRSLDIKLVNIHSFHFLPFGMFLKWAFKAKLVYDAHELETERYRLHGIRQALTRYIERIFIKYADLVIVVSDGIKDWYRDKYGLNNIVAVLNCPEFNTPQRTRRLHKELNIPERKKIVIYQGGLAKGRGVELLLKAFAEFNDDKYVLVFMGFGELEPLVREYAASHGNIYMKEAVEPASVLLNTAAADVGISYVENDCLNHDLCLPNKLFEYIMAGIPAIVINVTEMRRVVDEYKIGILINELTQQEMKRALDELERIDPEVMEKNLKRAASVYSWQNQERVMIDAYKKERWP